MKIDKAQECATKYGLEFIEVAEGSNGYPSNTYGAVTGFETFEDAEKFIEDESGLSIILAYQKYGWDLWECKGHAYTPIEVDQSSFGDNAQGYTKAWDEEDFVADALEYIETMDADKVSKLKAFVDSRDEIWTAIENMDDDEILIEKEAYSGEYEIYKQRATSFDNDSQRWCIAVI